MMNSHRLSIARLYDTYYITLLHQGPDLQNILRQSYDYLAIMPKLRSTYDRRLIHKTSYEGCKAFLGYNNNDRLTAFDPGQPG